MHMGTAIRWPLSAEQLIDCDVLKLPGLVLQVVQTTSATGLEAYRNEIAWHVTSHAMVISRGIWWLWLKVDISCGVKCLYNHLEKLVTWDHHSWAHKAPFSAKLPVCKIYLGAIMGLPTRQNELDLPPVPRGEHIFIMFLKRFSILFSFLLLCSIS
jgi:hypothetical protein